jgi:hypothetical protein
MKKKNKSVHEEERFMPWETGIFSRSQQLDHEFPLSFLLLCKLMDVTPKQLIADFADNLACGSWKREGRDAVKEKLIEYFLAHDYGQQHYSQQEIREIFKDMEAVGRLFPTGDANMAERYGQWRDEYFKYWFNKWYHRDRRLKPEMTF